VGAAEYLTIRAYIVVVLGVIAEAGSATRLSSVARKQKMYLFTAERGIQTRRMKQLSLAAWLD
jgi:hypothetical protein